MALKFDVAIRDYIAQYVRPLMYNFLDKEDFMPETMSTSFVARTIFEDVRKEFPHYLIKFSSDNPRNPLNQAGPEELKIIDYFNNNPQSQRWEGKISINDKPYFAKFRAMRMEVSCLRCHGDPENAPASLLKRYGSIANFHRTLGKVIGMDTIAIPIVKITEQLWPKSMQAFFLISLGVLLFFLSIIYLTRFIVTKRLSSITEHFLTAAQQSNYQEITLIEIGGKDEIRDLAVSFNILCDRLKNFYSSLETQVKDRTQELADKNKQMKREIEERKRAEEALKISRENLLEESNQRKILSKRLIDLLEKDRHEIAIELHDNIGQILTSLKIYLEIIDDKFKPTDTELGSLTKDAIKRANQAINDLNNIAHGLMPGILDPLGLVSSLRSLLNEFRELTDIKIDFFTRNVQKRFEKEKELAIYRIVQEALNNIIKHAEAKNVYVSLLKKGNVLSLSVEDDGVGFDLDKAMKISKGKGPLGLVIMRERAMQLDGEVTIESFLGKGTHILAEIPI